MLDVSPARFLMNARWMTNDLHANHIELWLDEAFAVALLIVSLSLEPLGDNRLPKSLSFAWMMSP